MNDRKWYHSKDDLVIACNEFRNYVENVSKGATLVADPIQLLRMQELIQDLAIPQIISCVNCVDGEYRPSYGCAPHRHNASQTGSVVGSTETTPQNQWPDNFVPDLEPGEVYDGGPLQGMYYCENQKCENHKSNHASNSQANQKRLERYVTEGELKANYKDTGNHGDIDHDRYTIDYLRIYEDSDGVLFGAECTEDNEDGKWWLFKDKGQVVLYPVREVEVTSTTYEVIT